MSKKVTLVPANGTTPASVVAEDISIADILFAALSADQHDDTPAAETDLNTAREANDGTTKS